MFHHIKRHLRAGLVGSLPGLMFALMLQLQLPGISISLQWNGRPGWIAGGVVALIGFFLSMLKSIWPRMDNKFTEALGYALAAFRGAIPGAVVFMLGQIGGKEIGPNLKFWMTYGGIALILLGIAISLYISIRQRQDDIAAANFLQEQGFDARQSVSDMAAYAQAMGKVRRELPGYIEIWEDIELSIINLTGWNIARGVFTQLVAFNATNDVGSAQKALMSVVSEVELVRSQINEAQQRARRERRRSR